MINYINTSKKQTKKNIKEKMEFSLTLLMISKIINLKLILMIIKLMFHVLFVQNSINNRII